MKVSDKAKQSAKWWLTQLEAWNGRCMIQEKEDITVDTDASDIDWGYAVRTTDGIRHFNQGNWSAKEKLMSINWRELRTVVHAMDENGLSWRRCVVKVRTDNITTFAIINKQGSARYEHLHSLAKKLAWICDVNKIRLFAVYLSGKNNAIADWLSRVKLNNQQELQLQKSDFTLIEEKFGKRKIDLLATYKNRQTEAYMSLNYEEEAIATDALQHQWPQHAYAYPPWILINRILAKLNHEKIKDLVLVTPAWTAQSWWGELVPKVHQNPIKRSTQADYLANLRTAGLNPSVIDIMQQVKKKTKNNSNIHQPVTPLP